MKARHIANSGVRRFRRIASWLLSRLSPPVAGVAISGAVLIVGAVLFAMTVAVSDPTGVVGRLAQSVANRLALMDGLSLAVTVLTMVAVAAIAGALQRARHQQRRWRAFVSSVLIDLVLFLSLCALCQGSILGSALWINPILGFVVLIVGQLICERGFGSLKNRPLLGWVAMIRAGIKAGVGSRRFLVGFVSTVALAGVLYGVHRIYRAALHDVSSQDLSPRQRLTALLTYPLRDTLVVAHAERTVRQSEDPATFTGSMQDLQKSGDWQSIPSLIAATRGGNPYLRLLAVCTLGQLKGGYGPYADQCYSLFVKLLEEPSARIREAAALGLRRFPDRGSSRALVKCLSDSDQYVRLSAVIALCCDPCSRARHDLDKAAHSTDGSLRVASLAVMALQGNRENKARLSRQIAKENPGEDDRCFLRCLGLEIEEPPASPPSSQSPGGLPHTLDPTQAQVYYLAGRQLERTKLWVPAAKEYRQCATADPSREDAWLAAAVVGSGDSDASLRYFLAQDPAANPELPTREAEHARSYPWLWSADRRKSGGPYGTSPADTAMNSPANVERQLRYARVLVAQGHLQEAERVLAKACSQSIAPEDEARFAFLLGSVRWKIRRNQK